MSTPSPATPRLGDRLSLRFDGPHGDAEVLGILVQVDPDAVTLLPEGKPAVRVPRAAIRAARVVPLRPVRPVSPIEDVATIAAAGWPAAVTERLGGWLLRAAHGGSGRANSVLPTGESGLPIGAAIEAVREWYADRALPARFTELTRLGGLTPRFRRDPSDLRAELDRQGWDRVDPMLVLVGDLRRMPVTKEGSAPATAARAGQPEGIVLAGNGDALAYWSNSPDEQWWAVDGAEAVRRQEMTLAAARYLTLIRRDTAKATASTGSPGIGTPLAVVRLAVTRDWCGVSNLTTAPDARGAGWGRAALAEALAEGRRAGARFAYLQVREDNKVARSLYADMGFTAHHGYAYRNPG